MSRDPSIRRGVYDSDYFSGAQVAIYIGDIWVDEVSSLMFQMREPRTPLYGYADTLWRDVSRGQVFVQGSFSVNFKEAGYLWLVLDRYKHVIERRQSPLTKFTDDEKKKFGINSEVARTFNIEEQYVQDYITKGNSPDSKASQIAAMKALTENYMLLQSQKILTGYASTARGLGGAANEMQGAESVFENFENKIWGQSNQKLDELNRRVTDKDLNPFDIYITYGDYVGDDRLHHTIQKLEQVYLVSAGKQIIIDGSPIQEEYGFIARNLV
jgi:hypothetical protein